jgi:hypothetical protein
LLIKRARGDIGGSTVAKSEAAVIERRRQYTVYSLLAAGQRFTDDYSEEDAIEDYLELHPDADEKAVRAELQMQLQAADGDSGHSP